MWFGFGVVIVGVLLLLDNLGILHGDAWGYVWPIAIILVGLSIIFRKKDPDCCPPKVKIVKDDKKETE